MDYTVLEKSILFQGIPAKELRSQLASVPHHIQCYEKDEVIFHLMEKATRMGIILEGRVEAQKPFPNGNQINVSIGYPGDMIGTAALFSHSQDYPCDIVALEPVTVMMFHKEAFLSLLHKDIRILEHFIEEISSITHMLQRRLELLSYSSIAQKAAFYLLMQMKRTHSDLIPVPESITKWALLLNVSRTSLHRELKALENQGILSYDSHAIRILDSQALEDVLNR